MHRPRISVIVPVYNAGVYLESCIDSILRQNIEFIEILLINDGSTDHSGQICDRYAKENKQIRVMHQNNQGVFETRKTGVRLAKAGYVTFVDSDDWIDEHMLEEMVSRMEESEDIDLVVSGLNCEKEGICFKKSGSIPPGTYDVRRDLLLERMLYDWKTGEMGIPGYACGKIFRRDLLLEAITGVTGNLVHGEDYAWFYSYVPLTRRIVIEGKFYYHYRMREKSTSTSFSLSSFAQLMELKEYLEGNLEVKYQDKISHEGVNQLVWGGVMHGLREIYGLSVGYLFPYELIEPGSRVVIYGAGVVGQCYYNCLRSGRYGEVVAIADKNAVNIRNAGCSVVAPYDILKLSFDVVVVAVEPRELYEIIKTELEEIGINAEKIVWSKPRILCT